ncbi:sugar ABC transporter permease [Clostridiales bacterium F-3ap]|uniref:Sugar ABC transporter permease n=2 Tax=Anaerotalea alkaliphila TaxID=2662126 RepID=A0A7X5HW22_9FIRM|nr:sugar ABC transporter permease [Anaerotalea alkaliphila]NDL67689.1 sugar ABC transporter permease [Anaerotalea alkaliphila]
MNVHYTHDKHNKVPFWTKARPYLIIAPSLLLTIGILVPFATAIFYSLTNYSFARQGYEFVALRNWQNILGSSVFWHSVKVTAQYGLLTTGLQMCIGLGVALLLMRENRYTKILRILLIFPLMIAPVIATLIWQLMLNNSVGIVEKFLNLFGVYNFPWASSPDTALMTAVMIDCWVYIPFVMLLMLAGLQSLPKSPFESAKIDGGSAWFTFRTLTLPMLKPFIFIALIFRLMAALQEYAIIFALTKGGPGNTLMNLSLTGYNTGFAFMKLGEALPYLLFLWAVIYFISSKLVKAWLKVQKQAAGN